MAKTSIETLIKGLVHSATHASALSGKVKGFSVRFAADAVKLAALGTPEALAEGEKAATQIETLPNTGKGYASNLRRVCKNPDGAAKVLKECSDPAVGFAALTTIFQKHKDVFPAETGKGGRPAKTEPMVKSEHRLDSREGAMLALQSIKAASMKLGLPMGPVFERFENGVLEALAALNAAKPEAK